MKKNLLKSAVLALTLTTLFATTIAPTFAAAYSTPEPAAAYSISASLSSEDILVLTENLNEKTAIVKNLYEKLEPKRQVLESLMRVTSSTVAKAVNALHSSEAAEIVSQLESNLAELKSLKEQLAGTEINLTEAENIASFADMQLSYYRDRVADLKQAISDFAARTGETIPSPSEDSGTSTTMSNEEILATAESLNEKIAIVGDLTAKLNSKTQELMSFRVTTAKVAIEALRALFATDTAEIVSQLESNFAELQALNAKLAGVALNRIDNREAYTAFMNAGRTESEADMALSMYKTAAADLDRAISDFEAYC